MANEKKDSMPAEVRLRIGQTAYKRTLAYAHLGIDPKDVPSAAFFRENLRRIGRRINRGRAKDEMIHPFDYLQSSTDPDALKVTKVCLAVPESYRKLVRPEAYCYAAQVAPQRVLELITALAVKLGAPASAVLGSVMLPQVVERLIAGALQPGPAGTKDRALFFKLSGWL